MRSGTILSLNKKAGIGLISDTNDQHIRFYLDSSLHQILRGQEVHFEIEFSNGGLTATRVTPIGLEDKIDERQAANNGK